MPALPDAPAPTRRPDLPELEALPDPLAKLDPPDPPASQVFLLKASHSRQENQENPAILVCVETFGLTV